MKKKFLLLLCFMLAGIGGAWADTSLLTTENGWTKVTDLSTLTLSDYYFAFVDNNKDLMLSFEEGADQNKKDHHLTMVYRTGEKAEMNPAMLWTLVANDGGYAIKSAVPGTTLYIQTEYNAAYQVDVNDVTSPNSWAKWNIARVDNSYFTIGNATFSENYIGPWSDANFVNGQDVAGNKTENNIGKFQIYAIKISDVNWEGNATESNPANYTFKITNHSFETTNTNKWNNGTVSLSAATASDFTNKIGSYCVENWWNGGAVDFNQELSGLPDGKYQIKALAICAKGSGSYLYAGNKKTEITNTAAPATTFSVNTNVSGGSLTIGINGTKDAQSWLAADNFEIFYLGPVTENYKVLAGTIKKLTALNTVIKSEEITNALATAQAMVDDASADNQAAIDAEVTKLNNYITLTDKFNDDDFASGWSLSKGDNSYGLITTYGSSDVLVSGTTSPATDMYGNSEGKVLGLAGGWGDTKGLALYSKSIESIPAGKYLLYYETYNNNTATSMKKDEIGIGGHCYSPKSFVSKIWEANANVVIVHPDGTKTITLGGIFSDTGSGNAPYLWIDNVKLYKIDDDFPASTVLTADAVYFFKTSDGKYISRGEDSNTQGTLDEYGIAVKVSNNSLNETQFQFVDGNKANGYMFWNKQMIYTNGTSNGATSYHSPFWAVAQVEGGYTIYNTDYNKYLAAANGVATLQDAAYTWTLETPAAHQTVMAGYKTTQATAAATAAGISATTTAGITAAITDWTKTPITLSALDKTSEYFQNSGESKGSIEITTEGLYKFTLPAYTRTMNYGNGVTNPQTAYAAGNENIVNYVYFGDTKLQMASLFSEGYDEKPSTGSWTQQPESTGKYYADNTGAGTQSFNDGKYSNTLYVYLATGTYNYGLKVVSNPASGNWVWYGTPTLTLCYDGAAEAADYTALNTAISNAEAKTLGFDVDEYAPYTNIAAIKALASAKAINQSEENSKSYVKKVTTALTSATWTVNTTEMAYIYNGSFWDGENASFTGWTNPGWGQLMTNCDQNSTLHGTGYYYNAGDRAAIYGKTTGYTLPLKANTMYILTFKYASQANNSCASMPVKILKADESDFASYTLEGNGTVYTATNAFKTGTVSFITSDAADYIVRLGYGGNVVVTDVALAKGTTPESVARTTATGKKGTICLPYAFTATGATIYTAALNGGVVELTEVTTTPVAGTPYIYKATANNQSFAPAAGPVVSAPVSALPLVGTFTQTAIGAESTINSTTYTNYVMQTKSDTQAFYKAQTGTTSGTNKCYLVVEKNSGARDAIYFDGEETSIEAINALNDVLNDNAKIYDLSGRQLQSLQKGVNIVNGKKIIVK